MNTRTILTLVILFTCICSHAQVSIITTIAGNGMLPPGSSGDGGPATNALLNTPDGLCLDKAGNIYIADAENNKIRKITRTTGIINTIAGIDTSGFSGDGGPATAAALFEPVGMKEDTLGNIYFADAGNNRIRKIDGHTGIITTIAGSGPVGIDSADSSGDGHLAINAQIGIPTGLCFDKYGNIYIADFGNNKVRKINAVTGVISTFAGKGTMHFGFSAAGGYSGDGGAATAAEFSGVASICMDSHGNMYVCDQFNNVIRKIDAATGTISTIAGTGVPGYSGNGGPALSAQLNQPTGVFIDKHDNIYIAEYANGTVRKIDAVTGIITPIAGNGTMGYAGDGGAATAAELGCTDMVIDSFGEVIIADYQYNAIRKVYNPKLGIPSAAGLTGTDVKLYPNPAGNTITIAYHFTSNEDGVIEINDATGKTVITKRLNSRYNEDAMDVSSLPPGVYAFSVAQNGSVISAGKLVKE